LACQELYWCITWLGKRFSDLGILLDERILEEICIGTIPKKYMNGRKIEDRRDITGIVDLRVHNRIKE
jgi:hypothetical protein